MDLIAVVSTDEDVWELRVRGQLVNETWSNIGIRWAPYVEDSGMYVKLLLELFNTTTTILSLLDCNLV